MYTSTFPDWKRVGRRIGKRLRDVLDPRPATPGPSAEERRAQRLHDGSVGLVYFDTFEEVESWTRADIDPIQQANQPLLPRAADDVHEQRGLKSRLLMCHDYKGGYHEYESVRPASLDSEWYSCKYLQYVDTFNYFSHKLVCIPPSSWTNALHRNGVKVLGTFLIEPQTPSMERLLTKGNGVYTIAKQLAEMAHAYGFDGWLLNIEQDAPGEHQEWAHDLTKFINELGDHMGEQRQLLWYDALTWDGDVYYQNGLTPMNRWYAKAAKGLFTNYKWTKTHLAQSRLSCKEFGISMADVFFGVDVWAQNTDEPGPPRITYPPVGGGGTNTGLAMSVLSANRFSTAMFAPAWAYEHFPTSRNVDLDISNESSIAHQVDESLWTGVSLPDELVCSCKKGKPHHSKFYKTRPILRYAQEFPAGSSMFFETRFIQPFQPRYDSTSSEAQKVRHWSSLGSQDPLPNLTPIPAREWETVNEGPMTRVLYGELSSVPRPSLRILTRLAGCYEEEDDVTTRRSAATDETPSTSLCLYKFNMPADGSLKVTINVQTEAIESGITCGFYLTFFDVASRSFTDLTYPLSPDEHVWKHIPVKHENGKLVELGVFVEGRFDCSTPLSLIEIHWIVIKTEQAPTLAYEIRDIHIKYRGQGSKVHRRLAWSWVTLPQKSEVVWPQGMPWSQTTGPFTSFTIRMDGRIMGQALCLEFPIRNEDVESLGDHITVEVIGHLFGNSSNSTSSRTVARADLVVNDELS